MIKLAVGAALAFVYALAAVATAGAQGSDIRISELDCDSDPELVVIDNRGDADQALAGWKLLSDHPQTEVFELSGMGELRAGASSFIQIGPSASGIFQWGTEFVFRNDDPTDYVRIVDDTGAIIDQVNCGDETAPTPTPSPTPTAEPSPPSDVPNGGGMPPVSGGVLSPLIMVLSGGSIFAAGLAAITLPWLRLRRTLVPTSSTPPARLTAESAVRDSAGGGWMATVAYSLVLVGLAAIAVLLVVRGNPT